MHYAEPGAKDGLCATCRLKMREAEDKRPKDKRVWQLYALQRDGGFAHFYPSTTQVQMCGDAPPWLVQLAIDHDGPFWAWYHSHHPHNGVSRGYVSMVYPHRTVVEICFPYGPQAETLRGRGEIVRLHVTPVRPAVHPEGLSYDAQD